MNPEPPTTYAFDPAPLPPPDPDAPPWSPGMTFLWGILLLGGYFVVQALVAALALVPAAWPELMERREWVPGPDGTLTSDAPNLIALLEAHMGLIFTVGTAVAAPLALGAILAVAWAGLGRQGVVDRRAALRRWLGLGRPTFRQVALWVAVAFAVLAFYEWLARLLDRPPLPDFMVEFHASAGWLPGLLFVVVVLAPLVEEVLFRGFMLPGLAAGRGGPWGAILVTALVFAIVHTQYDLFDMSAVLALGLLLGAARWYSGSLWLALGLHVAINGVAAAQLVWALGW
jgi:uncharacterized protein